MAGSGTLIKQKIVNIIAQEIADFVELCTKIVGF
jgi:hypothetical protein